MHFRTRLPAVVGYNIRIKDIRPDIEGIVGFKIFPVLRKLCVYDLPGKEHAACFAAEGTAADHTIPELEIISRPEVFPDHFLQSPVFCQRTLYNLSFCLPAEYPPLVIQLRKREKPVMTVIVLILVLLFYLLHKLIVPAHRNAAVHCFKPIFFPLLKTARMREEHLCRIAIPHFQRMEIDPAAPIHIQEKLRGIPDARNRLKRMSAPQQRKISHRVQLEQVRACHTEKVTHHQICVPYRLERRQAVEHIECIFPLFCNPVMDIYGKRLKPFIRIKLTDLKPRSRCKEWFMIGKTHIDQISPVPDRLLCKRYCKKFKILQICYAPDYIVTHPDII